MNVAMRDEPYNVWEKIVCCLAITLLIVVAGSLIACGRIGADVGAGNGAAGVVETLSVVGQGMGDAKDFANNRNSHFIETKRGTFFVDRAFEKDVLGLYLISPDGKRTELVEKDFNATLCTADDNFIYFLRAEADDTASLWRRDFQGNGEALIAKSVSASGVHASDGWVYFKGSSDPYAIAGHLKCRPDGTERTVLTDEAAFQGMVPGGCVAMADLGVGGGVWFFTLFGNEASEDEVPPALVSIATDASGKIKVLNHSGLVLWAVPYQDKLYYGDAGEIRCCDRDGLNVWTLADEDAYDQGFNVKDGWLYYISYQKGSYPDDAALCRVRLDGTDIQRLYEGVSLRSSLDIAGKYLYWESRDGNGNHVGWARAACDGNGSEEFLSGTEWESAGVVDE